MKLFTHETLHLANGGQCEFFASTKLDHNFRDSPVLGNHLQRLVEPNLKF